MDINIISHIIASHILIYIFYRIYKCVIYYNTLINNMYKLQQTTAICSSINSIFSCVSSIFTNEHLIMGNKRISKLANILFDVNDNVNSLVYKNKFNNTKQVNDTSHINTIIENLCNKMHCEQKETITKPSDAPAVVPPVVSPIVPVV